MKRKLIGVILMAVMVCSLAACGSKETKETKADADKSGTPVLRVARNVAMHHITGHSQMTRTEQFRSRTAKIMHMDTML